jgi:hypothetical protein
MAPVTLLEDEDFVWGRVWPLVSGSQRTPPDETFAVTIHRRREDGRAVAEYDFDGGIQVFAKLYPDDAAGRAVYRIHDELWRNGFGADSLNRVPEPLGYLAESNVLVARAAVGECLGVTLRRDWSEFEEGVARSARWLAALHTSSLSVGPREEMADGALRLARRMEMAAARMPELEELFQNALAELASRYDLAAEPSIVVQTHGRYHGGHVFVGPESVTAIDLDRAALAEPAKDVGEFVASLNSIRILGLVDDDRVDNTCASFIAEYIRHGPGVPQALSYYWSYCIVWALVRQAFKDRPQRHRWRERLDYLRSEFDAVPRRTAGWLG